MRHRSENSGSTPGFEAPGLIFGQLGKRGKWAILRCANLRRLENCARFAGIRIEPQDQEFGGERAQIDDSADERLPIVPFYVARLGFPMLRRASLLRNE